MNKERLEEVAQWLEAGAPERRFNMSRLLDEKTSSADKNWCGTECCIAGYVVTRYIPFKVNFDTIEEDAAELLGLDLNTSDDLFYPKILGSYSWDGGWEDITPTQAAKAVRNVMEHNNPFWQEVLDEPSDGK